ncbi:uncharacterized protein LOC117101948 [Anneissia japonica]|uniref:uncharacterized protein LOC117101948 n=1 Tax=Anneissia japonica TaxID=1529436 RepID=UPI0014257F24|nr:uncharacterized protein LOC117101948 [Anneissia japonica]
MKTQNHLLDMRTWVQAMGFRRRLQKSDNIYDPVALDEDPRDQHVHPIRPIARVQGYKVKPEVHNVGWQSGSHSAGTLKESKSFLEKVEWLYDSVKETREMYELDEVLRAVLFEGELRMFRHMDVIEETLYSFKGHLEAVLHDVVEIFKLIKEWLEMNYFDCFESYFLNVDIQQNLVSFVQ